MTDGTSECAFIGSAKQFALELLCFVWREEIDRSSRKGPCRGLFKPLRDPQLKLLAVHFASCTNTPQPSRSPRPLHFVAILTHCRVRHTQRHKLHARVLRLRLRVHLLQEAQHRLVRVVVRDRERRHSAREHARHKRTARTSLGHSSQHLRHASHGSLHEEEELFHHIRTRSHVVHTRENGRRRLNQRQEHASEQRIHLRRAAVAMGEELEHHTGGVQVRRLGLCLVKRQQVIDKLRQQRRDMFATRAENALVATTNALHQLVMAAIQSQHLVKQRPQLLRQHH
ncbi:hypothetical protein GQ600_971 [Phytophthora cactorum]|nr:hypothetical protein GQ600_971 [Phytophthora cactorum]